MFVLCSSSSAAVQQLLTYGLACADVLPCRGGGSKRRLREVDFVRRREGVEGVVERLEYDPNRTGYIALVKYPPGRQQLTLRCAECAVPCCAVR
jgi:ribosomal protein L2